MNIEVNIIPYEEVKRYHGKYTDDKGKEYRFTLIENVHIEKHKCGIEDIVWLFEPPPNQFVVEFKIESEFKTSCNDQSVHS